MARLKDMYRDTIAKKLMEEHGFKNAMEVPRITKITINMGLGEAIGDKKVIQNAMSDMEKIAGQKIAGPLVPSRWAWAPRRHRYSCEPAAITKEPIHR